MCENIILKINSFLKENNWCDFEIVNLKGNLIVGGKTGFSDKYDILITFEDVYYIQCLYEWKTDTSSDSFFIPDIEEQREINIKYSIEEGFVLFKIVAEDIDNPFYISAKKLSVNI